MDIVIRNGVIQKESPENVLEVSTENMQKKNFSDYEHNKAGPYYDFLYTHLCIPRYYNQISNFTGPQKLNKIKLNIIDDFNKKVKYCSICHQEMTPNPAFSGKRKLFYDDDTFVKKEDNNLDALNKRLKRINLSNKTNVPKCLDEHLFDKLSISKKRNKWIYFYDKLKTNNSIINIKDEKLKFIKKSSEIIDKYYKIIYKLTKEPILYNVSITETKLLYPWQLTPYQKFKLTFPDYKNKSMFSHNNDTKITENYVKIE